VSDTLSVIHVESGIETELFKIDPALSFIHDISGWSPSGEYIMYISKERNQEETNICISSAVTGESNCPHLTVDKLTVPFWLSDSANIGLLHFNSDGSEQFKNSDRLDVGNIDFSHIEIVELLGSDEP
jgi:hypothetical protein